MSYDSKVSCKYGAPMGRSSDCNDQDLAAQVVGKVHLRYMPLDSGGYDKGGAYWGHGARLYCAWGYTALPEGNEVTVYFRAADRKAAKAKLTGCTFFDGSGVVGQWRETIREVARRTREGVSK